MSNIEKESDTTNIINDLHTLLDDNAYANLKTIEYKTTVPCVKYGTLSKLLTYISKIDVAINQLYNNRASFPYNLFNELKNGEVNITNTGDEYVKKLAYIFNGVADLVKNKPGMYYKNIDNFDISINIPKFNTGIGDNSRYRKYSELLKLMPGLYHTSMVVEIDEDLDNTQWSHNTLGYKVMDLFFNSGLSTKLTTPSDKYDVLKVNSAISHSLRIVLPMDKDKCLEYAKLFNNNIKTSSLFEKTLLNYCRVLVLFGQIWWILHSLAKELKPTIRTIYTNVSNQLNLSEESLVAFGYLIDPMSKKEKHQLEQDLTQVNGLLLLRDNLIIASNEGLIKDISTSVVDIAKFLAKTTVSLYKFSKDLKDFITNSIVSEQRIHDRCALLLDRIKTITNKRAYVKNVPTLQQQRTRFLNLIKVVEYVETAASYSTDNFPPGDSFIENVARISGGLLTITRPSEGSTFKNLEWNEPEVTSYEITQSPWANEYNVNQLKALAITCKYDMADKLKNAATIIAKRCDVAKRNYTANAPDDDDNTYSSIDTELANIYTISYMVSKAVKQILKQGLQKEINTFTNTHISRLISFIYK